MQKIIVVIIVVLLLVGVGFVLSSSKNLKQSEKKQETRDDILAPVVIDRVPYESLEDRHPRGDEFVQGILNALDDLEDEDSINDLNALLAMGANLNLLEEKEEALEWYGKALLLDLTNITALNNIANIYSDLARYEESETAWLTLLEAYPNRVPAYRSLGYLYQFRLLKSPEEIEALFLKGLEATNNHLDLFNWLISYFLETGNNEKFVEYANLLNASSKSQ